MSPHRTNVASVIDFLPAIKSESDRFLAAIGSITEAGASLQDVSVPACPDWNAADLTWHLTEVQYFWATIVGDKLDSYVDAPQLERPADDALMELFQVQSDRLAAVLSEGADDETCWSWHPAGGTFGWVRRRQAQEALIHRVDAEQTAAQVTGAALSEIDADLAADGVDEMLRVMLDAQPLPEWASFVPSDASMRITVPQASWDLTVGRVVGTNEEGPQDQPAVRVEAESIAAPSASVTGSAEEIDLWLWRRGDLSGGSVRGNEAVVAEVRTISAVA